MNQADLDKLAEEIRKRLGERSQTWLAEQANVGQATISRILRGVHVPTPETLEAIARVLGADPVYLMRLAGLPLPPIAKLTNPEILYLAQQLENLPADLREQAIDAVGGVVDSFTRVAGLPLRKRPTPKHDPKDEARIQTLMEELVQTMRELRDRNPEAAIEVYEQLKAAMGVEGGEESSSRRAS